MSTLNLNSATFAVRWTHEQIYKCLY